MSWPDRDPSLVRAIESRYVALVGARVALSHGDALARAIYHADRTNGGLRYKALMPSLRGELETRLLRYRP